MDPRLEAEIAAQQHPFLYATVVGDRLHGFGDDIDVRGAHVLPVRDVVGLRTPPESLAFTGHRDGLDFEFLSHDVKKLCLQLLKKNGQVLEHIFSPLVIHTTPEHEELKDIARGCMSRHMAHHYLSHARLLHERGRDRRALRVLWTATHLMRAGEVESRVARLRELLDTSNADIAHWVAAVEKARDTGPLPPAPSDETRARLDDWLVRVRVAGV